MPKPTAKPRSWSAARSRLATWEQPALLDLLRDLYAGNSDNRDFIHARTQGGSGGAALESCRAKVVEQFFSEKGGPGELRLGEARKAIRTYRKATGDLGGTVERLTTYVESGATLTHHYGATSRNVATGTPPSTGTCSAPFGPHSEGLKLRPCRFPGYATNGDCARKVARLWMCPSSKAS